MNFFLFREAYGGKKKRQMREETENSRASEEHKKFVGEGNEIRLEGANQTTNSSGAEDKQSTRRKRTECWPRGKKTNSCVRFITTL